MSTMKDVADVVIDADGRFKYVLIKLTDGAESRFVVRGFRSAEYHADVFDAFQEDLRKMNVKCDVECVGGGRILHTPEKKDIFIYGYSLGFGQADHQKSVDLVKKCYPDYKVEFDNEGY